MRNEGAVKRFEDLLVWQKAHKLTIQIYKVTKKLPDEEKFGLISQMRRSAVSITANIVEGFRKRSIRDKINFYNIAQGSADELRYYIILIKDLGYLDEQAEELDLQIDEVGRMLAGLVASMGSKTLPNPSLLTTRF